MALSTNLISGLSSGFDWRSMIDQLIAIDSSRVDLVEADKAEYQSKLSILQSINTKLLAFKTKAETLTSSDAFNIFTSSLSTDSANYSASSFFSVSTNTSASPGTHTITMNSNSSVAQARQISSKSFSTYDTELSLTGEFVINGRAVSVESSDDLNDIMSKINNLNSGVNATGVTASILTASSSNYRLILMSDETGEDAFTIFDASADTVNILSADLGFTDGTTSVKNYVSNGFQSEAFSSSTQAVGSMLGLSSAQNGSVTIGDCDAIAIDLSQDSLTDIAEAINDRADVLVSNVSASVVSTTEDGVTTYRLKIENTTGYTDDDNVLQALGLLKGDQGDVAEVHTGAEALHSDAVGTPIVAGTLWSAARDSDGILCSVATGDIILIKGTKHDGTAVDTSFTLDATEAINDAGNNFLTAIGTAFGSVTAEIDAAGKIKITDGQTGDSQLSVSLVCQNNVSGGTLDFGTISATTEGYTMETQAGQDANITIDGTAVTSSSNIIDDVIAGVTLNLLTVEDLLPADDDVHVTVTVSRNYNTIKSSVQGLLDAYNAVISDINAQFAYNEEAETAGLLQGDSTLYSIRSSLQNIVADAITGLPTTINALSLIGINTQIDIISHKSDGTLAIDDDDFMDALEDNFNGVRRIFVAEGTTTDGDVQYINHSNDTVAGDYTVNIDTAAAQAEVTGTVVLTDGIGDDNVETVTIKQGSRVAGITLYDADGENGTSIDNIVNAINSELDTEYAQSLMGNIKNTTDAAQTTAITSSTTWDAVYSGGVSAGLLADAGEDDYTYEITFTGHKKNGTEVNGSYTINDAGSDTVQGLLSAIEAAYGYEVSAGINTYGNLVITDNTTGDSSLDITITEPESLDFGDVTTSNFVSSEKNTETVSGDPIDANTTWDDISGGSLQTGDVIKFAGWTADGDPVEGSFTVDLLDGSYDDVGDFLDEIESAYALSGGSVTAGIVDGRIMIADGTTNSTLGIEIFEPSSRTLDFGTLAGGVTGRYAVDVTASKDGSDKLVLTHDEYGSSASFTVQLSESPSDLGLENQTHSGVDVVGTINDESATGSGQVLTGDAPESDETTSVQGLVIKYTGTDTGSQGNVEIIMGVAELFDRVLDDITNVADGYLDYRIGSMGDRIDDFEDHIEDMEVRLNRKMETMINRFVAMELALAQIQNQGQWLAGQISASFSGWGSL